MVYKDSRCHAILWVGPISIQTAPMRNPGMRTSAVTGNAVKFHQRARVAADDGPMTVQSLAFLFLAEKEGRQARGDLSPRTYRDYFAFVPGVHAVRRPR